MCVCVCVCVRVCWFYVNAGHMLSASLGAWGQLGEGARPYSGYGGSVSGPECVPGGERESAGRGGG